MEAEKEKSTHEVKPTLEDAIRVIVRVSECTTCEPCRNLAQTFLTWFPNGDEPKPS